MNKILYPDVRERYEIAKMIRPHITKVVSSSLIKIEKQILSSDSAKKVKENGRKITIAFRRY